VTVLHVEGAAFAYRGGSKLFSGLDLTLDRSEVLCVLGPNGVGKSSLLRCLAGLERLSAGTITVGGGRASPGRSTGFVPQSDQPVFAFDVRTVVEMGRAPHLSWTSMPGRRDAAIVQSALARLRIAHLADRLYPELSGGERQLVMIARALAQQPALLILDEPTSHLDFANQADVLELVRGLADEGLAVLMTTHDPDHAFLVADQVLVLAKGTAHCSGPVQSVLTEERLSATYGRSICMATVAGRTLCFPARSMPSMVAGSLRPR
jgi:iron complex transport system ATP-binding protein